MAIKYMKKIMIYIFIFFLTTLILMIPNTYSYSKDTNNEIKVYFLSEVTKGYGQADCILLEKNGKYAMIDTGRIETKDKVVKFLNDKGVEELEFLIITHIHHDHIAGAEKVLNNFKVKKLYIKQMDERIIATYNQELYSKTLRAALKSGTKIIGPCTFGNMSNNEGLDDSKLEEFNENNTKFYFEGIKIEILNWKILYDEDGAIKLLSNENSRSLGILLTYGNKKAFFSGDIDNTWGAEDEIAQEIGKIDFLKLGHHGYKGSNTISYLEKIKPKKAIITNDEGNAYKQTIEWLDKNKVEYYYSTDDPYAVVVTITENSVDITFSTTGDVNGNGKVDTNDILLILRHILAEKANKNQNWILKGKKTKLADINNNGRVDINDVLRLRRELIK